MNPERLVSVVEWVATHPLSAAEIDCATAVMLKILDGKCKMQAVEKVVMAVLYDLVKNQPGVLLGAEVHGLIATARAAADDSMRDQLYEKRVLAETAISRPVMKAFKARIRAEGLFDAMQKAVGKRSAG